MPTCLLKPLSRVHVRTEANASFQRRRGGAEAGAMSSKDAKTMTSVSAWFALNICMGNINGWILKQHGFGYPVLLTAAHMVICWALSGTMLVTVMRPDVPRPANASAIRKVRAEPGLL